MESTFPRLEESFADGQNPYERLPTFVYDDAATASLYVAGEIRKLIEERQAEGKNAVLGLATGSTPTRVYSELVRMHKEEGLSFQNVITFNLDEYYPIEPDAVQSYVRYMHERLFDHVDIPEENVHIPDGTIPREEVRDYCRRYEEQIREAGGLDIQLLGIGRTGHIGFNEPGATEKTRTRLITLDDKTRTDAASDFQGKENVPRRAITMGVGSILDARRIFLMAWGEAKAAIIRETVEGEIREQVPATFLQEHPNIEVILDEAAAAELTRRRTPWLVRFLEWDDRLIRKAVVWLSRELEKPILKLTEADYNEHGLSDLVTEVGPAYDINIKVFNEIQHTITGWPGGKPEVDDTYRPERAEPYPKRVLVFSPHPGDDMIAMGGTLLRLVEHGHEVHLAYQTSGNIGVFDEDVLRLADFATDYLSTFDAALSENELAGRGKEAFKRIEEFLQNKSRHEVDTQEIRTIKTLIRRAEARAACRHCGILVDRAHFLEMPFYETGRVQKNPLEEEDIQLVVDMMQEVRPHQIFVAGDFLAPHETHQLCTEAVLKALARLEGEPWMEDCYVWLYRGAWQVWEIHEIDMAVPLSPDELERKRGAILKHESQRDRPLYPGADPREFWERAEARTRGTAATYDGLGLAEYEALESFVLLMGGPSEHRSLDRRARTYISQNFEGEEEPATSVQAVMELLR